MKTLIFAVLTQCVIIEAALRFLRAYLNALIAGKAHRTPTFYVFTFVVITGSGLVVPDLFDLNVFSEKPTFITIVGIYLILSSLWCCLGPVTKLSRNGGKSTQ